MPRFSRKQEVLREIDNRNSILLPYGIQPPLSKAQSVSSFGDVENTKTTFTVSESITKLIMGIAISGVLTSFSHLPTKTKR